MIGALNTAATGMAAQEKQMETISNNIANASTTAYKKTRSEFEDLLYEQVQEPGVATSQTTTTPIGIQRGSGTRLVATQRMMEGGNPKPTQRELDVMINGDGFFMIATPTGRAYSRDGAFKKDATGQIVNAMGYALEPQITVPQNSQSVSIGPDGMVSSVDPQNQIVQIGQIQLARFVNPEGLKSVGDGLYLQTNASGAETVINPGQDGGGDLLQRHLESSNVNTMEEMVNLISAQRGYEINSRVMQATDQMMQSITNIK